MRLTDERYMAIALSEAEKAMKKEEVAMKHYTHLADVSASKDLKKLFTDLAGMEREHKFKMEKIFIEIGLFFGDFFFLIHNHFRDSASSHLQNSTLVQQVKLA